MLAAHVAMHQIFHGNHGAFAGLEDHRTDGWSRGSTPLEDFNIGRFRKLQRLIADIGDPDIISNRGA